MSYLPDRTSSSRPAQKPFYEFQDVARRLRHRPCKNKLETQILLSLIEEAPPAEMERLLQQWWQRKQLTVVS